MEELGREVGDVGDDEDDEGLQHPHVLREPGDEAGERPAHHPDAHAPEGHHEEGQDARPEVHQVDRPHLAERPEHLVQHLAHQTAFEQRCRRKEQRPYDGDAVVEKGLPEDDDEEALRRVRP